MTSELCKKIVIILSFSLITLGNSMYLINQGVNEIVEYAGLFLLMLSMLFGFIKIRKIKLLKSILFRFAILTILFCSGLLVQDLSVGKKLSLIISMIMLVYLCTIGEGLIHSYNEIKAASIGIVVGCILSTLLAVATDTPMFSIAYEGMSSMGFNAGLENKNFFGYAILGSFSGLSICYKFEKRKNIDLVVMIFEIMLIIVSNARGAYIGLAVFLVMINFDLLKRIKKSNRQLFLIIIGVVGGSVAIYLFVEVIMNSSTYMYRFRGLGNYFTAYWGDWFHMIFGCADMAYRESGLTYVMNVRTYLGMDGTVELSLLNILIKNGILGVIAYLWIFARSFFVAYRTDNWKYRVTILAIMVPLLVSGLVETFITNIHLVYGPFCYCVAAGFCGLSEAETKELEGVE